MSNNNEELRAWMGKIKDFKGGWPGFVVIVITVVATFVGGWFGLALFPDGSYPKIVLAIPGLLCGGIVFVFAASATLKFHK